MYGGFRPGDNLFGTSVVALDLRTGGRRWHFQTVRHDVWDRDNPHPPILLDLQVDGTAVPAAVQVTKQGLVFAFHRETGEPLWPIEDVPDPASQVPGERLSPTQPVPSRPALFEIQGLSEEEVVDFTPELRAEALERLGDIRMGPLFNPPIHRGNPYGYRAAAICPGFTGGANIIGGAAADPEMGILYGEGRSGLPRFHAVDKATGERVGTVDLPAPTTTAPMTFLHEGRQYIVTAVGAPGRFPGSLVALRLP